MCGIFGINSNTDVRDRLITGLTHLEYRGYDSAGVAGVGKNGDLRVIKTIKRVAALAQDVRHEDPWTRGIAHTRWATHGKVSLKNAHPIASDRLAIVHNGIVENNNSLKSAMPKARYTTDTDTEVLLHLVTQELDNGRDNADAVRAALEKVVGSFAVLTIFKDNNHLIASKRTAPLIIGLSQDSTYVSSDAMALRPFCTQLIYLEDNDVAVVDVSSVTILNQGKLVERPIVQLEDCGSEQEINRNFPHKILEEIYAQESAVKAALASHIPTLKRAKHVYLVGCGSSYYAGLLGKRWIEQFSSTPSQVYIASEFNPQVLDKDRDALILLSQSGETADLIAIHKEAQQRCLQSILITNCPHSTLARMCDEVIDIKAGPEMSVASTKAFTNQLITLLRIAGAAVPHQLDKMVATSLAKEELCKQAARIIEPSHSTVYIGRGIGYALALEGALKMKELSYIHAEGISSGELKHGHIALIDETTPVVAILLPNDQLAKATSNVEIVLARSAPVILIADEKSCESLGPKCAMTIPIACTDEISFVLSSVPILQLIAYHAAVMKDRDIDRPRNLAKSVTVE